MNDIIQRIIKDELTRENDEKGKGGFYDLALDICDNITDDQEFFETSDKVYSALWELYEECYFEAFGKGRESACGDF